MLEEQLQFQKAVTCLEQGELQQAEAHLQQVLCKNAGHIGALVSYVQCLNQQNRQSEALPLMAVLQSTHPDNSRFTAAYADALRKAGRFDDAIFPLRSCLQRVQPDADLLAALAQAYADTGDTLNAQAFCRWALALDQCQSTAIATLAHLLAAQGAFAEAIDLVSRAIQHKPKALRYRLILGDLFDQNNQKERAVEQLLIVKKHDIHNADLWGLIGKLLVDLRHYTDAKIHLKQSIHLQPKNSKAVYHLGQLHSELGEFSKALQLFEQALTLEPKLVQAAYNRALCLMSLGRFRQGFAQYYWRWQVAQHASDVLALGLQAWDGIIRSEMHLLVWTEQGIGDGVFFSRVLSVLQCQAASQHKRIRLTFACDPRLKAVFQLSFPGCEFVAYHEASVTRLIQGDHPPEYQIAIGDLFTQLWHEYAYDDLATAVQQSQAQQLPFFQPYLQVDPQLKATIQNAHQALFSQEHEQKPRYRIGISWHSIGARSGRERSLALADFLPIMQAYPGIQWVSLQYGDHQSDIDALQKIMPKNCQFIADKTIDAWHDITSFMAQIAGLDMVISIDNSTIHMSGALGVPTWLLLGPVHNWRWPLQTNDALWYSKMQIKRWGQQSLKESMQCWQAALDDFLSLN